MDKNLLTLASTALLLASAVTVAVTGLIKFPAFGIATIHYRTISDIHDYAGLFLAILLIGHVAFFGRMLLGMAKSYFKKSD